MLPSLILNVLLNLYLIPEYGANGAAISTTMSYSLAGILFLYFYASTVDIPVKEILNYKKTDFNPIFLIFKKIISS